MSESKAGMAQGVARALPDSVVEVQLSRSGPNGRPVATLLVAEGTPLTSIVKAQEVLYRDLITKLGLKACDGCRSGLDFTIQQRFDDVARIDIKTGKVIG